MDNHGDARNFVAAQGIGSDALREVEQLENGGKNCYLHRNGHHIRVFVIQRDKESAAEQ